MLPLAVVCGLPASRFQGIVRVRPDAFFARRIRGLVAAFGMPLGSNADRFSTPPGPV
jgi:hypothetical protein